MKQSERVWTVLSMLEWATKYFQEKMVPDPRLSIEWILAEALEIKRLDLYLQFDRPLSSEELDRIRPLVKRRARHEPLQYITGSTEFINTRIEVNEHVLIPRIETEQMVDLLLDHFKERSDEPLSLLDIGTGSGCIPIAIKKEFPEWSCAGLDISEEALEVATNNAAINETEVHIFRGNIDSLDEWQKERSIKWDIIISNPPYITHQEKSELHPQVIEHEPHLALFHDEPLQLYENIVKFAANLEAKLYLECNDKLARRIQEMGKKYFNSAALFQDLDDNDRFVVCNNS